MNLGQLMVLNKKIRDAEDKQREAKEYEESLITARKWFAERKLEMEEKVLKGGNYDFYFKHGLAVDSPAVRAIFHEEMHSWCVKNDLIAEFVNSRDSQSPKNKQFLIVEPIKSLFSSPKEEES